jgi:hypothetical protein
MNRFNRDADNSYAIGAMPDGMCSRRRVRTLGPTLAKVCLALPKEMFDRERIPYETAFLAAKCFVRYATIGAPGRPPLVDLFIGAHPVAGYQLMTRAVGRCRAYFPNLGSIAPE